MKAIVYKNDPSLNYTDPGFTNLANYFAFSPGCKNPTTLEIGWVSFSDAYYIDCNQFETPSVCNSFKNCNWTNTTFFNIAIGSGCKSVIESCVLGLCKDLVNVTFYGYPQSVSYPDYYHFNSSTSTANVCENITGLSNQAICEQFGCTWVSSTDFNQNQIDPLKPAKAFSAFWEAAKFMFGFRTELGFKQFGFLYQIFFTYIPLLMLFYALYMALPFLHG